MTRRAASLGFAVMLVFAFTEPARVAVAVTRKGREKP